MVTRFADLIQTPIGQFLRDLVEGGISMAVSAVLVLNLDITTPKGIIAAATAGFTGGVIAVARRKLVDIAGTKTP